MRKTSKVNGMEKDSTRSFREGCQRRPAKGWGLNKEGVRNWVSVGKMLQAEDSGSAKKEAGVEQSE